MVRWFRIVSLGILCIALINKAQAYSVPLTYTSSEGGKYKAQVQIQDQDQGKIQSLPLIVDTGSPVLLLPGSANVCPTCFQQTLFHVARPSELYGKILIHHSGGDRSVAKFYPVIAQLGQAPAVKLQASVIVKTESTKLSHAILGLSPGKPAKMKSSYLAALSQQKNIPYVFGLLLCRDKGELDMGSISSAVVGLKGQAVAFNSQLPHRYSVQPNYLSATVKNETETLDNFPQGNKRNRYVLDSGTADLVLNQALFDKVVNVLTSYVADQSLNIPASFWTQSNDHPISITEKQMNRFPVFHLGFSNGVVLNILPQTYLRYKPGRGLVFMMHAAKFSGPAFVLGQTVLRNYYVEYNWEQGKAIFYSNNGLCN